MKEHGHAAFEWTLEQLHWVSNVNDIEQAYNGFCDVGLERSADDRVVRRSKLVKAALRDCITRCVCMKVGFSDNEQFDAEMEGIFRERLGDQLRSQLHNAYWQNVRRACLRSSFTSQSQIANEARGRVRPRREHGLQAASAMRFLALEESDEIPGAGGSDRPVTDISLGRQRSLMF